MRILYCLLALVFASVSSPVCAQEAVIGDGIFGGTSPAWHAPVMTTPYAIGFGDSRVTHGQGSAWSSPTFTSNSRLDTGGFLAWVYPLSGNAFAQNVGASYGETAQTSAGIAGRLTTTGIDCNTVASATATPIAACFTGSYGTASVWNTGANTGYKFTYTANGSSPWTYGDCTGQSCPYVESGQIGFGCQPNSISGTTIDVSNCTLGTGPSLTANSVVLSPVAKSSNFVSFLGGNCATCNPVTTGASGTDVRMSSLSGSGQSPRGDPATVVFLMPGSPNDWFLSAPTLPKTISNIAAELNGLKNKIVVISDETPVAVGQSESSASGATDGSPEWRTIPSVSPYTITVAGASSYIDTQEVFYAPCSSVSGSDTDHACGTRASAFSPGVNDGVALTQVTSAPAIGQYSVASGVYTFNSLDAGKKVALHYRWLVQNVGWNAMVGSTAKSAADINLDAVHDWIAASAASGSPCGPSGTTFVGLLSGQTLPAPGVNCPSAYPWVHVAQTWEAMVSNPTTDPAGSATIANPLNGIYDYSLPFMHPDGGHPTGLGSEVIAAAMLAAVPAGYLPTQQFTTPSLSDPQVQGITNNPSLSSSTSPFTSTCNNTNADFVSRGGGSYSTSTTVKANHIIYLPAPAASVAGISPGWVFIPANPTSAVPAPSTVTCVDTTNNYIVIDAAETSATTMGGGYFYPSGATPTNILPGGVFNMARTQTLAISGCTGTCLSNLRPVSSISGSAVSVMPATWTSTLDTASAAAVTNGTFGLGVAMEPTGDGDADIVVTASGYAGANAASLSFSRAVPIGALLGSSIGDIYRASCEVMISAGQNGRITGFGGPEILLSETVPVGSAFSPPGLSGSYTGWNSLTGLGSTWSLTEQAVALGAPGVASPGGTLKMNLVSNPVVMKVAGGTTGVPTGTTMSFTATVSWVPSDLISGTARIRRCQVFRSTY